MSPRSKKEYTEAAHRRYKNASHIEKTFILNELCATSGYHRKYAIRLLRGFKRFTKPKPKRRGPKPVYRKDEIITPLKQLSALFKIKGYPWHYSWNTIPVVNLPRDMSRELSNPKDTALREGTGPQRSWASTRVL